MSSNFQQKTNDEIQVSYGEEQWTTEFEGKITDINVNGNRIMEIHDMSKKLHTLIVAFTGMCVVALGMFGTMLYICTTTHTNLHEIQRIIENSEKTYADVKTIKGRQKHYINGTEPPTSRPQVPEDQ